MKTIIIAAVAALLTGATVAGAQTSHIFGSGGQHYQFSDVCQRVTIPRPGISDHEALNLLGQQVTCLAKREKRIRNCFLRVELVFMDDHHGKPGDWLGVDRLQHCGSL